MEAILQDLTLEGRHNFILSLHITCQVQYA